MTPSNIEQFYRKERRGCFLLRQWRKKGKPELEGGSYCFRQPFGRSDSLPPLSPSTYPTHTVSHKRILFRFLHDHHTKPNSTSTPILPFSLSSLHIMAHNKRSKASHLLDLRSKCPQRLSHSPTEQNPSYFSLTLRPLITFYTFISFK